MAKKAKDVEFDLVRTNVEVDTVHNRINCSKVFYKNGEAIYDDLQIFDLCIFNFSVAMQLACAFVQCSTLTEYE